MKKMIVGGLIGAALTVGVSAHAEVTNLMIGKVVDGVFPVKLNGQTLHTEAIVIEGTSYLPVRAFSETLGMEVRFDMQEGISLYEEGQAPPEVEPEPEEPQEEPHGPGEVPGAAARTVDEYNTRISTLEQTIESMYLSLSGLNGGTPEQQEKYKNLIAERDRLIEERDYYYPDWNK
ncbi:hypothetical protein [Paenibacillus senegalensis]|uniref:hypothetical protein n=1 Tax=Paenibacillus senegalensis TaxID=1465766 RepID=UPI00028A2C8E|nr:hypothetical protein [Paenibacillus senegalensis]